MLPDFIRHTFTLQMEILSMVAEEIQQQAESYVQSHSDEAYEAYLNNIIDSVEKTVDFFAGPAEVVMQSLKSFQPTSDTPPGLPINWNEALSTLNARIQDIKNNLQA